MSEMDVCFETPTVVSQDGKLCLFIILEISTVSKDDLLALVGIHWARFPGFDGFPGA